jgi:hypothetical protein
MLGEMTMKGLSTGLISMLLVLEVSGCTPHQGTRPAGALSEEHAVAPSSVPSPTNTPEPAGETKDAKKSLPREEEEDLSGWQPPSEFNQIAFDSSVPIKERKALVEDFKFLVSISHSLQGARLAQALGLSDSSGKSLYGWLTRHLKGIFGNGFSAYQQIIVRRGGETTPLGDVASEQEYDGLAESMGQATRYAVAANLGGALFGHGKLKFGLILNNDYYPIDSPFPAYIYYGMLFSPEYSPNPGRANAVANSIARLAALFHEAMHSVQNKKKRWYVHSECPKGHPYAGQSVCDKETHGPYGIEVLVLAHLREHCLDCSLAERDNIDAKLRANFLCVLPLYNQPDVKNAIARSPDA